MSSPTAPAHKPGTPVVPDALNAPDPAVIGRLRSAGCVFAEDEAALLTAAARTPGELAAMVDRRVAGQPLEQVVGWAEFRGLRIHVAPGVFVPRRRTEFLVDEARSLVDEAAAKAMAPRPARPLVVVDLCCGTGALGAALVHALRGAGHDAGEIELHAADVDPAAVRCARRNLAAFGGRVHEGDLFDALPAALRGRVGVLLSNVPYVPTGEIALLPAEARDHEARVALDGGEDGLGLLRRVTAQAAAWLAPGGHVLFETSERQVRAALDAVTAAGLAARVASDDDLAATVIIGTQPPP